MSYKKLVIWQEARQMVLDIHKMTLNKLPQFELYEEGSQIRRSIKSVKSNLVEGYGRRRYKQEYIRFLTYSLASCDETTDHLETLYETESLTQSKHHRFAYFKILMKKQTFCSSSFTMFGIESFKFTYYGHISLQQFA